MNSNEFVEQVLSGLDTAPVELDNYGKTPAEIRDAFAALVPVHKGDAYGFIGPIKPPSADHDKRDARWFEDQHVSSYYAWGRSDSGDNRNANDVYNFGVSWADAQWEFRGHYRSHMPSMQGAYVKFFAGECI